MRLFVLGLALLLTATIVFILGAVNPEMPHSWGWNAIDRITDPRPFHDFSSAGLTSIARSGEWVAAGSERDGLILVRAAGIVPRDRLTSTSVLDVTAGTGENEFLALQADQQIERLRMDGLSLSRRVWVTGVRSPKWQGAMGLRPEDILLARLDHRGLLLVSRRAGPARYQFREEGGALVRTRDWQQPAERMPAEQVVPTRKGLWLATSSGVRFADIDTLQHVPDRNRMGVAVGRLDAGQDGDWASIVGTDGQASFFAAPRGWSGPWFGLRAKALGLRSVADVRLARMAREKLWLATATDLFSYDPAQRSMKPAIEAVAITEMDAARNSLLVSSLRGLFRASDRVDQIDSLPTSRLSVSPSGDLAVYQIHGAGGPVWRAVPAPFEAGQARTVTAEKGWDRHATGLTVVGVGSVGDATMFATSAGCFLYEPSSQTYSDCSRGHLGGDKSPEVGIPSFQSLTQDDGPPIGVAKGTALVYRADARKWYPIDPSDGTSSLQLTAARGRLFGLAARGQLFVYNGGRWATTLIGGAAPALRDGMGTYLGDLEGTASAWRMALVANGQLVEYQSQHGKLGERPVPAGVRQVRVAGDRTLLVLDDGVISSGSGSVFGDGALHFPPNQISALAQGKDNSVLVGGPGGRVARYSWGSGSWRPFPQIPSARVPDRVTDLDELPLGVLARLATGSVHRWNGARWQEWADVFRWVFIPSSSDSLLWLLERSGLRRLSPDGSGGSAAFSSGDGMRDFAESAVHVWQPDADRVIFFGAGPSVGIFDRRTDQWRIQPLLAHPTHFRSEARFTVVMDGLTLKRVDSNLGVTDLINLPRAADDGRLHLDGNTLTFAHRTQGRVVVVRFHDLSQPTASYSAWADANALDVEISADGRLWLLLPGQFVEVKESGSRLIPVRRPLDVPIGTRRIGELAASGWLRAIGYAPAQPPRVLARLDYGPARLEWIRDSRGGTRGVWQGRPDLPVWSQEGRLVMQAVHDIAIERGEVLVLATDFGLIRRNARDFSLLGAEPGGVAATLDRLRGTRVATSGSFEWGLYPSGLSVRADRGGESLSWVQARVGFRLREDIVDSISKRRDSSPGLVLETGRRRWAYDVERGRTGPAADSGSDEDFILATPVMRAVLRRGHIRFETFDGSPALEDGRFFFDRIAGIRGHRGALYTLTAGRGIFRRDATNPGSITGAWRLPAASGESVSLVRGANGLRVETSRAAFELIETPPGATWQAVPRLRVEATTGLFDWVRAGTSQTPVEPHVRAPDGRPLPIANWWAGNSFSWDRPMAVCALDHARVLMVTSVGLLVRQLVPGVGSRQEVFWPNRSPGRCVLARQGGQAVGVLIGGNQLVRTGTEGRPTLLSGSQASEETPVIVFGQVRDPRAGRYLGLTEEWRPARDRHGLFESRVPVVPVSQLISRGQFVFDQLQTAAPARRPGLWFTAAGCADSVRAFCAGVLNEEVAGRLVIREIVPVPGRIVSLRSASGGTLYGRSDDGQAAWGISFVGDSVNIAPVPIGSTEDAFEYGDRVILQLPEISWTSVTKYVWDSSAPFQTSPVGRSAFVSIDDGLAFGFDIFTTLSASSQRNEVAIGTWGGVFLCEFKPGEPLNFVVNGSNCRLTFDLGGDVRSRGQLVDVSRLRRDEAGTLWAKFGTPTRIASLTSGRWMPHETGWPLEAAAFGGFTVRVEDAGVWINGTRYDKSLDAWGIGVRPLTGIIDLAWDPRRQILWLCSREHGLVKVRLRSRLFFQPGLRSEVPDTRRDSTGIGR